MTQKANKLIIICGLPGSGKTTLAKKLAGETLAVRLSPDEWIEDLGVSLWDGPFRNKMEDRLWKLAQELLKLGESVILEYGFWAKSERDEKLQGARKLGVEAELYYLDVSDDELRGRLKTRGQEGDDLLAEKISEFSKHFERPNKAELKQYDNYSGS